MGTIITRKVPHMIYGGDYNPEQWPEEVWDEDASFLFLLNHDDGAVDVRLAAPGRDLLTADEHYSLLVLDPLGVAVLREEPEE